MDVKEDTDYISDEVFFGKLTLKEVKKRIFMDLHQNNLSRLGVHDNKKVNCNKNNDFKLIETNSQPNMLSPSYINGRVENLKSISDPLFNRHKEHLQVKNNVTPGSEREDSFLEIEKNVGEHCMALNNCDNNLDNTLEFVDFILNHAQSQNNEKKFQQENGDDDNNISNGNKDKLLSQSTTLNEKTLHKEEHNNVEKLITPPESIQPTPIKSGQIQTHLKCNNIKTEVGSALNTPYTPIGNKKLISNLFKTPKIPHSARKDTCEKKTPSRSKAYEHIASPIATYIRNGPQVPLVKDIHPTKPLPSTSLIPKLVKNVPEGKYEKENLLPQLAYRSAKKTVVIDVKKEKLPQSHWAQKLTTSSQKPAVLKHNHRENIKKPLFLHQEDSFQDLTLHQADISVCTQKPAFNKP